MGAAIGVAAPAVITANKQRPVMASGKRHLYKNLGIARLKERLKPFWFRCCFSLITRCWLVVILRLNININKYQWLAAKEQEHIFPELLPIPVVQPLQVTLPLPIRLPFPFSRRDTGPVDGTLEYDTQNYIIVSWGYACNCTATQLSWSLVSLVCKSCQCTLLLVF